MLRFALLLLYQVIIVRETFKKFAENKLHNGYQIYYTEIQTISPVFFNISQILNVSTFGYTADIYTIIHFILHACQHITVDQSRSSGDTAAS
jgi:hypothetical protein